MRKNFRSNKRAQITIFIILALLLVVGIIFIFLLRQTPKTEVVSEENPQAFIESCTRQAVEEALDLIMIHSGSLESRGSVLYEGQNISYLCYTNINYRSCVNQQPLLIEHIEDEIYTYIKPRVANCFQTLEATLEPGYEVEMEEDWDLTPRLTSHGVEVEINRDFKMQRGTNIRSFNLFKISIIHPIYRLAEIAVEIVNQEAKYCNFDTLGFMIIYPKYDIKKFRTGNSDTIYSLKEIKTDKSFNFAVRSCTTPAGF